MGFLPRQLNIEPDISNNRHAHKPEDEERDFLQAVMNGNIDFVRKNCEDKRFTDSKGVGQLSTDAITNLKYHMVITTALITRACIYKGLESETAFQMSDFYIQKLDYAKTIDDITEIHDHMVLDFTGKMRLLKKNTGTSKNINKAINYIYSHIKERITVEDIAGYTKLSASYLSRQFSKETGISISDYIREKKTEEAKTLLKKSEYSIQEIADMLSFSSQSHFIQIFKNYTGMTPKKYRSVNTDDIWS